MIILSCSDDDKNDYLDISTLEQDIKFDAKSTTKLIQTLGVSNNDIKLSENAKDWITTDVNNGLLKIDVKENDDLIARKAEIIINQGGKEVIISILQEGLDIENDAMRIGLGGNSYFTKGEFLNKIKDDAIYNWNDPEAIISTYVKVVNAGKMKLYLQYKSENDNKIIVSHKTEKIEVSLPKTQEGIDGMVYIGEINCDLGYNKIDMQGKDLNGSYFAKPSEFLAIGEASKGLIYVKDFDFYWGRRGPSVHMKYTLPTTSGTIEWFYNEVTVPEGADQIGSYFMSNGFNEGYFGMQVNSETERRVLFSVWSPYQTDDPTTIPDDYKVILTKKGEDVIIGEFGNEGSGGQSYWKYNWKAGKTYKFLNRVRPLNNGFSEYTGYFYSDEIGAWKLIAQFKRPYTNTFYAHAHSFAENFNKDKGYLTRKAHFNNQWCYTTSGQWIEMTEGTFTGDNTAKAGVRMDYAGGLENNAFYLMNGGFFNDNVTLNTVFNRSATGNKPTVDLSELEDLSPILDDFLDTSNFKVIHASTYATAGEGSNGKPELLFDKNLATYWHSQWTGGTASNPNNPPTPHQLVIDMQNQYTITEIDMARRNNNADTQKGIFYTTTDDAKSLIEAGKINEIKWTEIGTFTFPIAASNGLKPFDIKATETRYIMISITETKRANTSSLSEIEIRGH